MSTVLTKKQMTEEDIKLQYITPAIISKFIRSLLNFVTIYKYYTSISLSITH